MPVIRSFSDAHYRCNITVALLSGVAYQEQAVAPDFINAAGAAAAEAGPPPFGAAPRRPSPSAIQEWSIRLRPAPAAVDAPQVVRQTRLRLTTQTRRRARIRCPTSRSRASAALVLSRAPVHATVLSQRPWAFVRAFQ